MKTAESVLRSISSEGLVRTMRRIRVIMLYSDCASEFNPSH